MNLNLGKLFTFKVWGIRVKLDDILGAIVFYVALKSISADQWGGLFLFAGLAIALAIPEDDPPRQIMEALSGLGLIYCGVLLSDLPIPLMPFGVGLEGLPLKVVEGIAKSLGWIGLVANLLEVIPVLGKVLWETFRKPAEKADERRKKTLERRLKSLE